MDRDVVMMKIGTSYEREIHIRELSDAEVDVLVSVIKVVYNTNMARMIPHLRHDYLSYINEEGYLTACKWDGKGGLRNLGAYIKRSLEYYTLWYMKTRWKQYKKFGQDPSVSMENGDDMYVWDLKEYATEDVTLEMESHKFYGELTDRQAIILRMVEEGRSTQEIQEVVGIASRTIRTEKKKIRTKAVKYFGEGTGNGYKRRNVGGNMKTRKVEN